MNLECDVWWEYERNGMHEMSYEMSWNVTWFMKEWGPPDSPMMKRIVRRNELISSIEVVNWVP